MSLRRRARGGFAWSAVQSLGSRALTLGFFVLLARLLGPEDIGVFSLVLLLIGLSIVLVDFGIEETVVRSDINDDRLPSTLFWISLVLGACATVVLCAISFTPIVQTDGGSAGKYLLATSPVLLVMALGKVPEGLIRRRFGFQALALRQLATTGAGGAVGIAGALLGLGVWSLVLKQQVEALLGGFLLWKSAGWRPTLRCDRAAGRAAFGYGIQVVMAGALDYISRRLDAFFVNFSLGTGALGIYSTGQRLHFTILEVLQGTTSQVSFNAFAEVRDDPARLNSVFVNLVRMACLIMFPLFGAVAGAGDLVVAVLLGPAWQASGDVFRLLALSGFIFSATQFNATLFRALGRPQIVSGLVLINLLGNLIACWVTFRHGIVALAAGFVARSFLLAPINVFMLRRVNGVAIPDYLRAIAGPGLAAIVSGIAMLGFRHEFADLGEAGCLAGTVASGVISFFLTASLSCRKGLRELLGEARRLVTKTPRQ